MMRLLLDTHVAIWAIVRPQIIPPAVQSLIADHDIEIFVSVVALWEIGIKTALGRPDAPPLNSRQASIEFGRAGYSILNIAAEHVFKVEQLPLLHGDPFDRMMVAQALTEPMRFVTHDSKLARYSDTIIAF